MSSSPWGKIQHSKSLVRGVRFVSTASHGGIMVTENYAQKHFSKSAIERALKYTN